MSMLLVRSVVIKRGKLEKQWKTTITGGFKGEIHQTKLEDFPLLCLIAGGQVALFTGYETQFLWSVEIASWTLSMNQNEERRWFMMTAQGIWSDCYVK